MVLARLFLFSFLPLFIFEILNFLGKFKYYQAWQLLNLLLITVAFTESSSKSLFLLEPTCGWILNYRFIILLSNYVIVLGAK